ncbi:tetratricopeptide repeat protein [candidate division WOR-3 bacterium]|nr:tetratricopeptide repeat protein [candidate division WOR-3 bacterium]
MSKAGYCMIMCILYIVITGCATVQKSHYEKANELVLKKQIELAIEEHKEAIAEDSMDIRPHFDLAYIYCEKEMWEEAIPLLERVAKLESNYRTANMLIAKAYAKTERLQDLGLQAFPQGVDTTNPNLLYVVGVEFYNKGFFERACKYLERVTKDERYYTLYPLIAQFYCSEQKYSKAIKTLRKYLEKKENVYERLRLSMIYKEVGSIHKAEDEFNKVIALTDTFYQGKAIRTNHYWKGMALYMWGKYSEAIKEWETYRRKYPKYVIAYHNLCTLYLTMDCCSEFIKEYVEAKKQFSEDPIVYIDEGFMEIGVENYNDALTKFKLALDKWPSSGVCNGYMAYTLEKLGRYEEAKQHWNLCILRVPGGVNLQDVRAFIEKMVNNAVDCTKTSENE